MKRVLLKLSGEALAGDKKTGFDEATCLGVAHQVKELVDQGIQVAIVTGGGNFWRGRTSETIDRVKADQIGMLATVMNCIYVSDIFRFAGMDTEVFTPFVCGAFTTLFSKDAAVEALNKGKVIFFAGGTGHPYFSTDTGAVLRAIEIEADAMLLAKAIDGIYDSDPKVNPEAKKYGQRSCGNPCRKSKPAYSGQTYGGLLWSTDSDPAGGKCFCSGSPDDSDSAVGEKHVKGDHKSDPDI